jgi:hypothetical protein
MGPTHFGLCAKGHQFSLLASIATMIASAANVTTHHLRQNPSAGNTKVLCMCCAKTFCISCTRDSLSFGRKLIFKMSTEWMATAYETLTRKYPGYRNRWISDDKWLEIIRNNYIDNPSKEKEEELKFSRGNMVRAIGSKGKSAVQARRLHGKQPKWHIPPPVLCHF